MKAVATALMLAFITTYCFAQDLTDEKTVPTLKNVLFKSVVAKNKSYSIILKDNTPLTIKYNVVESGEYNASYAFIKTPVETFFFNNTKEENLALLLNNLPYWASTLGFTTGQIADIKKKIISSANAQGAKKKFFISLDVKGYDEAALSFANDEDVAVCKFYFRRLL